MTRRLVFVSRAYLYAPFGSHARNLVTKIPFPFRPFSPPLSLSPTISPKLCLFLHPREKCKRLINRSSFHNFEDQIGFRIVFFHFQTWVPLIFLDFSRRSYIDSWIIERLLSGSINNSDITGWFAYGRKMEKIDGAGQMADTVSRFPGFCLLDYASFASGHLGFRGLARSVYSYARLFGSRRPWTEWETEIYCNFVTKFFPYLLCKFVVFLSRKQFIKNRSIILNFHE